MSDIMMCDDVDGIRSLLNMGCLIGTLNHNCYLYCVISLLIVVVALRTFIIFVVVMMTIDFVVAYYLWLVNS
jgi:hypothetical protein